MIAEQHLLDKQQRRWTVACIQLCGSDQISENISIVSQRIHEAARAGAEFIATPEMTSFIDKRPGALAEKATTEDQDAALTTCKQLAKELHVWLLIGSLPIRVSPTAHVNRSFLLSPAGIIVAKYDKIHLFDVDIGDGQRYQESHSYQAGDQAIVAALPACKLGLTICYDLRFPGLYRCLAQAGAEIIAVPAAFTRLTGKAHWQTLLRARAIENGCFIIAPAQGGRHADGRDTYGHSLIIGPWGEVLADGDDGPGIILTNIDLTQVAQARRRIPSLQHDRPFSLTSIL